MCKNKINIFLGGYLNFTNAQNLNCLSLAKYLNKERFNIYSLELYYGNLESQMGKIKGLKIFNIFYPAKISMYLGFLWGIYNCDVAYLPKKELLRWNLFWIKILNKKSFSTIEGIINSKNLKFRKSILKSFKTKTNYQNLFNRQYPITNFIKKHYNTKDKTLYLGCETSTFNYERKKEKINSIIYIGQLIKRKGVFEFLEIAKQFPELEFSILGNDPKDKTIKEFLNKEKIKNVKILGLLDHQKIAKLLRKNQLHILPSRVEGFPKVILETASAGIPSIVYGDYGANEWITHNHNGWVVDTLQEIIQIITNLKDNPETLSLNARNAKDLALRFDWTNLISNWEKEIINLYNK